MGINNKVKSFIRSYLNVAERGSSNNISIQLDDDLRTEQLKYELWYNGKPGDLQQFYEQYDDNAGNSMFWKGRASNPKMPIRKIHTGLPALIIDKIVNIVIDDMGDIEFYNGYDEKTNKPLSDIATQDRWEKIDKEHDFKGEILKEALKAALLGDCVFKISLDPDVSKYPIIEIASGRDVDLLYKRGRYVGADFYSHRKHNKKSYYLKERYQTGGVYYNLYNDQGHDVTIGTIEDLSDLKPISYNDKFVMAVPLIISKSSVFKGRGKSILDGKEGSFDSFDEIYSQWMDAIRAGRTNKYIPESLLPRDAATGATLEPNSHDNQYIRIGNDMAEQAKNEIKTESPDIQSEKYLSAYVTALDLCLQGIISPSTLGIDVKKLDNAEAQREKEKATLYTRDMIVSRLEKVIPRLIETVLWVDDVYNERELGNYDISVDFGGYANPSFEAQVETIGKARDSRIMSIERAVEELYGDSLTTDEKAEEVHRIKLEEGLVEAEPQVNEFDSANDTLLGDDDGQEETDA